MSRSKRADAHKAPSNAPISQHSVTRRDFLGLTGLAGLGGASAALGAPAAQASAAEAAATSANDKRVIGWLHWDGSEPVDTPFIFEPSMFKNSAMKYDAHLATFACCVAMASFNLDYNGGAGAAYKDEYRNIRSLFNQIGMGTADDPVYAFEPVYDGSRIQDGYRTNNKPEIGNVAWNRFFLEEPSFKYSRTPKCSIGLCVGQRQITVNNEKCNLVILGIRGGNYGVEWAGNLYAGDEGNHQGFQEAADEATRFLRVHIAGWGLEGRTKILITGFSRAAATANLAAANIVRWAIEQPAISYSTSKGYFLSGYFSAEKKIRIYQSDLYAYCFEAPAGCLAEGDAAMTAAHEKYANIHSIINPCDFVPKVMPRKWNFTRYGVDKVLPGPTDRASYLRGRDNMLARLHAIGLHKSNGNFFGYDIDDFPAIDFTIIGDNGQLALTMYDMKSLDIYLENFFNSLATEGIPARVKWTSPGPFAGETDVNPGYTRKYQDQLVNAILLFDKLGKDPLMSEKDADGQTPLDKLISVAHGKIMAKITDIFFQAKDGKPLTHVTDGIEDALKSVKLSNNKTVYEHNGYGSQILGVVHAFIDYDHLEYTHVGLGPFSVPVPDEKSSFSSFVYNHIQEVVAFASKVSTITSAHLGHYVLAWMQSRDSYYNMAGDGDIEGAPALGEAAALSLDGENGAAVVDGDDAQAETAVVSLAADDDDADDDADDVDDADDDADDDTDYDDDTSDADDDDPDMPQTYRKVIFEGNATITYDVNGQEYTIFKDGSPVYASDEDDLIKIEGQECPFTYGLDKNLNQVVLLPDSPNEIDEGTDYVFRATTEPNALLKCAVASYEKLGSYPIKANVFKPVSSAFHKEPLEKYGYRVSLTGFIGQAATASGNILESVMLNLKTPGFEWMEDGGYKAKETDEDGTVATRYCYIDAISNNSEMGYVYGSGSVMRGLTGFVVAVPNDGYEFDYWTLDDKWMVDGKQADFRYWVEYSTDEEGNVTRIEPEIPQNAQWVEGERAEGEMYRSYHAISPLADDYHLVTAHFKAAPADDGGSTDKDDDADKGDKTDPTPSPTPDGGGDGGSGTDGDGGSGTGSDTSGNGGSSGGSATTGDGSGSTATVTTSTTTVTKKGKGGTPQTGDSTFSAAAAVGIAAVAGAAVTIAGNLD